MTSVIKSVKELVNPKIFIERTGLFAVLTLFLALYGARLQPKLPPIVQKLFKNVLFRSFIIFLILYTSNRDMGVALTITIMFMVISNILQTQELFSNVNEFFQSSDDNKGFNEAGYAPVSATSLK